MHFALAKTPGGRPTTVTTAAISEDSPRTSAVQAPSVFLPHSEPSTSRGVTSSPAPDADDGQSDTEPMDDDGPQGTLEDYDGPQCTLEDYDLSSEDEYSKSGSTFSVALGTYAFERNMIVSMA